MYFFFVIKSFTIYLYAFLYGLLTLFDIVLHETIKHNDNNKAIVFFILDKQLLLCKDS